MHAILVLPSIAWLVSFANWSEQRRLRMVKLASAGYVVLAGAVAAANVTNLELRRMPFGTEAALALGALLILITTAMAVGAVARAPASRGIEHG